MFGTILIIILSSLFFLTLTSKQTPVITSSDLDAGSVRSFVEFCIEKTGKDALEYIGNHGGYFEPPDSFIIQDYRIPYYFYEDRNLMPSKEKIEQELSKYIDEEMFFCLRSFIDFREQGFDISQGKVSTQTMIKQDSVLFNIHLPLKITKSGAQRSFDSFSANIPNIRLHTIYTVIQDIIKQQYDEQDSICISCLVNQVTENNLHIDMQKLSQDTILFTISDNDINYLPYKFTFANKYKFGEINEG